MADFCAVSCLDHLLDQAVQFRASDVHIRFESTCMIVDMRVDGRLKPLLRIDDPQRYQLVARIKSLASLDVAQRRIAQDGVLVMPIKGTLVDIRVATLPAQWAEAVSLRFFYPEHARLSLLELGCTPEHIALARSCMQPPHGLILVTGPTGSGKSTTLRALIGCLDTERFRVVTLEDPIEYTMPGITQCHLTPQVGFDVQEALKAVLRQDPDVLVIGEIRDQLTARVAIQAALTGHLVLSTLHTADAPATLIRLLDMAIPSFLLQAVMRCIIAQRLVRRICPVCHGQPPSLDSCHVCQATGFQGRTGIFQVLSMSAAIGRCLRDTPSYDNLAHLAHLQGCTSLYEQGMHLVKAGITTREELLAVCALSPEPDESH